MKKKKHLKTAIFSTNFPDPDYKLKSAAQTPATLHNSRSNDLEVFGRPVDDRKTYLNAVSKLLLAFLN